MEVERRCTVVRRRTQALAGVVILCCCGWAGQAAWGQTVFVFDAQDLFLTTTAATAEAPLPNLGAVASPHTVGDLTFSLGPNATTLFLGTGEPDTQWTERNAGHDLALGGREDLNIDLASPVRSLGFEFVEPESDPNLNGDFLDSVFQVTLRQGGAAGDVVGVFDFMRPNDVLSFVGIAAAADFDRVEIRETTGGEGHEFFGQFFTGTGKNVFWTAPGGSWDNDENWTTEGLPAPTDAVFLAPAAAQGVTVIGPADDVSIRALQVGSPAAPSTALQIQSTGSLTVTGAATIGGTEDQQASVTIADLEGTRMHVGGATTIAGGGRLNLLGGRFSTSTLVVLPGGLLNHSTNGELEIIGGRFEPGPGVFQFGPTNVGDFLPVLSLTEGASAHTSGLAIGQGDVSVHDNARWDLDGELIVGGLMAAGAPRVATLNIADGGQVTAENVQIGVVDPFRQAVVNVRGHGSLLAAGGLVNVGPFSQGTLHVADGGEVRSNTAVIGESRSGTAIVTGEGSQWTNAGFMFVGQSSAELSVLAGGRVATGQAIVDANDSAIVLVEGSGSVWDVDETLTIGNNLRGDLEIRDGGAVSAGNVRVGAAAGSDGQVVVGGAGASLDVAQTLQLGPGGAGMLDVRNEGHVRLGEGLLIHAGSVVELSGGRLEIEGDAGVDLQSGGLFNMTGGTLAAGRFDGSLVQDGGTLAPGALRPGAPLGMTITGGYTLNEGVLAIEIGGPAAVDEYDQVNVQNSIALGGTLHVNLVDLGGGTFTPAGGQMFDILTAGGAVLGTFAMLDLPNLSSGLSWNIHYALDRVTLEVQSTTILSGDYNGSGQVEQADLDLVLLNWGLDGTVPPSGWINDLPFGNIDQEELDKVLLNWGQSSAALAGNGAAAVPEPVTWWLAAVVILSGGLGFAHHRKTGVTTR